jgi:hypothetical protein
LIFLIPGLAGKWLGKTTLLDSAKSFGLLFLPVVALGHLVKAVFRITSRLPYYPLAFKDPVGYSTANLIASGDLKVDTRTADAFSPWMTWIAVLVFVGALLSVWCIGLKESAGPSSERSGRHSGRASHIAVATVYGVALTLIALLGRL